MILYNATENSRGKLDSEQEKATIVQGGTKKGRDISNNNTSSGRLSITETFDGKGDSAQQFPFVTVIGQSSKRRRGH